MEAGIVARIDDRLARVAREHGVTIPLAIESGSRAWGFPSPDSDYDCRFIYVRPLDHYLALHPHRDVIETPLDAVFDVNGWDLAKALRLMLRGNAVVVEWLTSPLVYGADTAFRTEFLDLAGRAAERSLAMRHYLHLGERNRRTYLADPADVPLKKLFYALRPAVMLRWLRLNPTRAHGPMDLPTLVAETDVPANVGAEIVELLARKAETRELGRAALPDAIARLLDSEFDWAREASRVAPPAAREAARREADAFFRATVRRFDGT
ncbi:nucleotidyltransferase domain-containing protein [Ancylobacter oerskovii]|nr:nucleotidyltransferase domain-containing protein [Ancylobacter oerskovii]